MSKKETSDGFKLRWKVKPTFVDVYRPPQVRDRSEEYVVTVAQSLWNTRRRLELSGKTSIRGIRIYKPPLK